MSEIKKTTQKVCSHKKRNPYNQENLPMTRKILVVEDNQDLAKLLDLHLRDLAYEVDLAFDGDSGWAQITSKKYDR